jgi:hypothetical protein
MGLYFLIVGHPSRFDLLTFVLMIYLSLTVILSFIAILGGAFFLTHRHYRFCLGAVIISMVVGLIGGFLVVVNFPISLWSLLVLRRPDVAALFQTHSQTLPDRDSMHIIRFVTLSIISVLGVAAAFGYVAMIDFGIALSGMSASSSVNDKWTLMSFVSCLPAVSFLLVTLACLPIVRLQAIKFVAAISFLFMTPLLIDAARGQNGFAAHLFGEALVSTAAAFFIIYFTRKKPHLQNYS